MLQYTFYVTNTCKDHVADKLYCPSGLDSGSVLNCLVITKKQPQQHTQKTRVQILKNEHTK